MQVEQLEILDFLAAHPPFDDLPEDVRERVAAAVDVRYYKAGEQIVEFGQAAEFWHVVRSGAVEAPTMRTRTGRGALRAAPRTMVRVLDSPIWLTVLGAQGEFNSATFERGARIAHVHPAACWPRRSGL